MSDGKKFSALLEPSFVVLAFLCLIVALSRTSVRFNGIVRNFLLFAIACVEFCARNVRGGHSNGRSLVTATRYCCLEGEPSSLTDTLSQYYPGDYRCYRAVCRRQGQRSTFVETMCSDVGALAQFCTLYSMAGMAFCGFVGVLISRQPFLITGLKDVQHCQNSAFGAMQMFVITFLISSVIFCQDSIRKRRAETGTRSGSGGQAYSQVPRMESLQDYRVNVEMTSSHASSDSDQSSEGIFT
mmetsp:Transcript_16072/g.19331  ORF Transcript_16072/g.19331 Transcript_16072/m.19331 type:complete len:241 (+) Transcript_16072:169-891(+)